MRTDARQLLGKHGEDLACTELLRRGYAVLARRYRTRHGEIDIVARHRGVLVFVEVKARDGAAFGGAAAAVTAGKQARIGRMAVDFLTRRRMHGQPCRFDVVTVEMRDGRLQVEVLENAFDAPA